MNTMEETKMNRASTLMTAIATAVLLLNPAAASAQAYPSRPITVIVPFAAGGPVDVDTRRYAGRIADLLGQSVVTDYKPGAGTSIGARFVAKSKPDGYTLLSDSAAFSVFPAFYKNLDFDPVKDLIPITVMHESMAVMLVPVSSPFKTFAEYLAFAKANPGKINYGTSGVGDISFLAGAWLHSMAGSKVSFVPYKGNGPMVIDLIAGRVDISGVALVNAVPFVRQGKLRALAVRGPQRAKPLPDIPAVKEHAGLEKFSVTNWTGFFGPAGMPAPVLEKLSNTFIAVTKMPVTIKELDDQGNQPVGNTPDQFKSFVTEEIARWKKIVADNDIKGVD